jgi:hypothetical protein
MTKCMEGHSPESGPGKGGVERDSQEPIPADRFPSGVGNTIASSDGGHCNFQRFKSATNNAGMEIVLDGPHWSSVASNGREALLL